MLVLSRKVQGSIVLGDNIILTILRLKNKKVWIGIDAPRDVVVLREELFEPEEKPQDSNEISKEKKQSILN